MKKLLSILLCSAVIMSAFSACAKLKDGSNEDASTSAAELDFDGIETVDPTALEKDDTYSSMGEELASYYEQPKEVFLGVCKFYGENGWENYSYSVKNGNLFATYVKNKALTHIYWIACESELNIAKSSSGGRALPPKEPAVTGGEHKTTVTQLKSPAVNGMGYACRLADGSFILYDGGDAGMADEMWSTLVELNGSEDGIVIRAWILTHEHADHYPAFCAFSEKYADRVTLETVMISPLDAEDAVGTYFLNSDVRLDVARFEGAELLTVRTGMTFNYCNVKLEILFTADELFISEPRRGESLGEANNFNNSSIVSRIVTDGASALFLADASEELGTRLAIYYGDYLRSYMCQVAHHGVEDFPLLTYRLIKASVLWYPCSQGLYDLDGRDADVRKALRESEYTKEIILHDASRETRELPGIEHPIID